MSNGLAWWSECNEKYRDNKIRRNTTNFMFIQRISIIIFITITTTWTIFDHFSLTWFPLRSSTSSINHQMHQNLTIKWRIRSQFLFLSNEVCPISKLSSTFTSRWTMKRNCARALPSTFLSFCYWSGSLWSCSFRDNAIKILFSLKMNEFSPKIVSFVHLSNDVVNTHKSLSCRRHRRSHMNALLNRTA